MNPDFITHLTAGVSPAPAQFSVEAAISAILDQTLHDLEAARQFLAERGFKDADEIRRFVDVPALRSIEHPVDYPELLRIIDGMRAGVAKRRLAAELEGSAHG